MSKSSRRTDNLGRAGPKTAAVFREVSITSLSEPSEGATTYEKEQSMTYTATAWRKGGPPRINANTDDPAESLLDHQEASGYGASVREELDKARYPRSSKSRQSAKSLQKAKRPSSAKPKTSRDSSYRNSERPFSPNHSSMSQRSSARRRKGVSGAADGLSWWRPIGSLSIGSLASVMRSGMARNTGADKALPSAPGTRDVRWRRGPQTG